MKKISVKKNYPDSDDNFAQGKRGVVSKDKSSKKRLSIYDEYAEEEDDIYPHQEKFKNRRK
ncbi:hypothetical protein MASR2M47_17260 [Draconibacterium sp.]|jgi:hypothetical protein